MYSAQATIAALEYPSLQCVSALPEKTEPSLQLDASSLSSNSGFSEEEVQARIEEAKCSATQEAEASFQAKLDDLQNVFQARVSQLMRAFERERNSYFSRVEDEVVKLGLSIARKILERESVLDPMLLRGLVSGVIHKMNFESVVRVRVSPDEVSYWTPATEQDDAPRFDILPDPNLRPGDCIVETEFGSANLGLDAQFEEVEEVLREIMAQRPAA